MSDHDEIHPWQRSASGRPNIELGYVAVSPLKKEAEKPATDPRVVEEQRRVELQRRLDRLNDIIIGVGDINKVEQIEWVLYHAYRWYGRKPFPRMILAEKLVQDTNRFVDVQTSIKSVNTARWSHGLFSTEASVRVRHKPIQVRYAVTDFGEQLAKAVAEVIVKCG